MYICRDELHLPDVQALLALHVAAMRAATPADHCHVMPTEALDDPAITFLSTRDAQGALLGIGALRRVSGDVAEIKSMRVHARALRQGVGRFLLQTLTDEAQRQRFTELRLETGTATVFEPAIALYRSAGFGEVAAFEGYLPGRHNLFLAKAL